jgi:hypothetical protein
MHGHMNIKFTTLTFPKLQVVSKGRIFNATGGGCKQNRETHWTSFQQCTLRMSQRVERSLALGSLLSPMEIAMKGTILIGR